MVVICLYANRLHLRASDTMQKKTPHIITCACMHTTRCHAKTAANTNLHTTTFVQTSLSNLIC